MPQAFCSERPIRILMIDDDEEDILLVEDILAEVPNLDFVLESCHDFERGLEAVLRDEHDVYLIDYYLGPNFGLDIIGEARKQRIFSPMILLTGRDDDQIDSAASSAGASDYLVKNQLSPPLMSRSIRYALAHRRTLSMVYQSEARFRAIIEASPDGVFLHRERRVIYVNPAGLSYLGYENSDEVLGRPFSEFIHAEDRREAKRSWTEAHLEGKATALREVRFVRSNAEILTAEVVELCLKYEGTETMMTMARDITERQELRARVMLTERMASLGTLAAGVAHEINNPLSFVTANLEFAQNEVDALGRQLAAKSPHVQLARQALADARDGAERVRLIVGDLKHFSRGEDEKIRPVDIHEILEKTLTLAQNQIRHRAQVIRRFGQVAHVKGNAARLGQVFLNLIVNAAQAIPEGTASENRIILQTEPGQDDDVVIRVRDTGKGIAPDVLERIFDPFFTTKPVGEGMGLGLPICHGIITGFGGAIQVRSKEGQGTVVEVRLPGIQTGARPKPRATDTRTPQTGIPAFGSNRGYVAVIDDEPLIGDIVQRALCAEHDVEVYSSGRDVLAAITEGGKSFDVILCDLMMPDVTGMDMYEALVRRSPAQARRMVFMTGGAFTPQARSFVDEVDNVLIEKPFDLRGLKNLIRDLVKNKAEAKSP